jgi:TrmH family RNA methyltransferase
MLNTLSMALSKNKIQFIISLQRKKVRDEEGLFIIEGDKIVREYFQSANKIKTLIAKPEFISDLPAEQTKKADEVIPVSYEELKKVSTLRSPHNAMAIVKIPDIRLSEPAILKNLSVALDFIQDPGNLGTIIRAAAWFGIKDIVCSETCVDVYNPKVIQATMGAILNVNVHYTSLVEFLSRAVKSDTPVYGAVLDGEPIYSAELHKKGVILLGNESKGISDELLPLITHKIMIPKYTDAQNGIDSLNAGMAASIVFSEFARREV